MPYNDGFGHLSHDPQFHDSILFVTDGGEFGREIDQLEFTLHTLQYAIVITIISVVVLEWVSVPGHSGSLAGLDEWKVGNS